MNSIFGHYKAPGDANEYEYDATWRENPSGLTWSASVRTDGQLPSYTRGMMHSADAAGGESAVHEAIERAIEQDRPADDIAGASRGAAPEANGLRQVGEPLKASDHDLLRPYDAGARTRGNRFVVDRREVVEGVTGQLAQGKPEIGDQALRVFRIEEFRSCDKLA